MVGQCKNCGRETEDIDYVFCDQTCQEIWVLLKEHPRMSNYDIDKDVYEAWLKEKHELISAMTSTEQIEARILEISKIEFYAKREWALLHQQFDKLTGRKGIAPWLKAERDKMITDPNIKVNWDGEPREKKKKVKEDLVKKFFDHDIKEMTAALKKKKNAPDNGESKEDNLAALMQLAEKPKVIISDAEKEAKLADLRERMRKAKEAKEGQ